jgi:small-conductance mechanosensitive channel
MNMDTLKYLIEYFDLKDFIANNHPLRLLGIFITMMVLLVLAHIVCSIIEKKIIKLTSSGKTDESKQGDEDDSPKNLSRIDTGLFTKVMHSARLLLYLLIFGWTLDQLVIGPIYHTTINVLFTCLCTLGAVRFVSAFIPFYFDFYFRGHGKTLKKTQTRSLMPIIQGLIWAIGLTFLLDNVGLHVSTIIAGLGIVGVAVGLAGQAILSDFFSYIVILLDKPFQVGDFLELSDGKSGSVEYIGPKTTRLLSLDGDTIVCANASLTRGILVNMGNIREREVILEIGVAYATPMPVVRKLPEYLMEVVNSFPQCRYERACMLKFGSANYLFQLIYKVSPQPGGLNAFMDAQSNVNLAIQEMLNNRKIAGAYPTETILLNNVTPPPTPPEHKQEKQEQDKNQHGEKKTAAA